MNLNRKLFFAVFAAMSFLCHDGKAQPIICPAVPPNAPPPQFLIRVTGVSPTGFNNPAFVCEVVTQDPTTVFRRDGLGKLFISAQPTAPPTLYSVVFNAQFLNSNKTEDASTPPTPFDGQLVWCISPTVASFTSVPGAAITANQLATLLPIQIIEVRQASGTSIITTMNPAFPNDSRHRWNQNHPKCGGTPGLTFAAGSDQVGLQADTGVATPLAQMFVVVIGPSS